MYTKGVMVKLKYTLLTRWGITNFITKIFLQNSIHLFGMTADSHR